MKKRKFKTIIITYIFSQNIFYLTHKCICEQIKNKTINKELLENLKKHSLDIIKNQIV